ncbi:hypothetical protein [Streptomyces yangpuensis]
MPDPAEIALISSAVPATLTFLYQRLEHLIGPRRGEAESDVSRPDSLVGTLQLPLHPDAERLQVRERELEALHLALQGYASRDLGVDVTAPGLLRSMAMLRTALEDIYGQRLTFEGEDRPASGPFVDQKLTTLTGEATGMDADEIAGNARVTQEVETVEATGKLIGMKGRRIGG